MQAKPSSTAKKRRLGEWKPFFTLVTSVKLPWHWIIPVILVYIFKGQLNLIVPDATAKVMAGDISMGAILYMVVCLFLGALLTSITQNVSSVCTARIEMSFQEFMMKKTMSLPMPFYDRNMANRLITRVTSDSILVSELIAYGLPYLVQFTWTFIGTFMILFSYNWRLVVLEAIMLPIVLLVSFLKGRLGFAQNNQIQTKVAELAGYLSETLVNIPLVKVFVKEKTEEKKGQESINGIYKTKKKFMYLSSMVSFLGSAQGIIQTTVVVLGGAALVRAGHITLEQWIAFYVFSSTLLNSFDAMIAQIVRIKAAQGASRRMAEVSVEKSEDQGGSKTVSDQAHALAFENVTFRYDKDVVLKNVSFTVPAGKTTALVGPSGAGKSTIFGLLERFYIPESGKITLDGQEAKEYDLTSWRQAIGYVPQSSPLFSGTIRSNMTYGVNREVTEAELIRAAKDADIYEFIQSLPDGFDSDVGEQGGKLSGGQRQRVAIARALLKDPKILLLDEATSSLDPEAKDEVEKAMERLKKGRTTVVIAHELKSVENADQIIVVSDGTINGAGSHERLMRENKLYRSLKELQSGEAVLGKA